MAGYAVVSLLPDADVVKFALDIPYGAPLGHRGASHSIAVGLALGVLVRHWRAPAASASFARRSSPRPSVPVAAS
jgi:inner membrane protein